MGLSPRRCPAVIVALLTLCLGVSALTAATAARAGATPGPERALRTPGRDADFPRLPGRCYDEQGDLNGKPCRIRTYSGDRPTLVVWGDSHAWQYVPALRRLATERRVSLILLVHGGCPPGLRVPRSVDAMNSACDVSNERFRTFIDTMRTRDRRFKVLVSANWSGYRANYRRMQREAAGGPASGVTPYRQHIARIAVYGGPRLFQRMGRQRLDVDAIGQSGTVPENTAPCAAGDEPYRCDLPRTRVLDREDDNRRWLRQRLRDLSGPSLLVDTSPEYCDATTCFHDADGVSTWFDDLHLSASLTRQMSAYFVPVIDDLVR